LNHHLLHKDIQDFIRNYTEDLTQLALVGSPFQHITVKELIQQIEGRRKIEKKLPAWFAKQGIYYPPKIHLEQTSSEASAKYKASLAKGESLADITGGFGIDSYYFSENFKKVDHFDHNGELSEIAAYNFKILGISNISCHVVDGLDRLKLKKYDTVYADPSRRHDVKGKVFFLRDCEPNIPANLSFLLESCDRLMIKTSPMLDISSGLEELKSVAEIHVVAVDNEVKELLWVLQNGFAGNPKIFAVNLLHSGPEAFSFVYGVTPQTSYSAPKHYLYEPNAAIMKSGAFDLVGNVFRVEKLHKHTHLYTSSSLVEFPGRRFIIDKVIPYSKQEMKKKLKVSKANITIRNFPESVSLIRKKWKIEDGGDHFLFFTTLEDDKKVVVVCKKV
jgi:hypothetical protein